MAPAGEGPGPRSAAAARRAAAACLDPRGPTGRARPARRPGTGPATAAPCAAAPQRRRPHGVAAPRPPDAGAAPATGAALRPAPPRATRPDPAATTQRAIRAWPQITAKIRHVPQDTPLFHFLGSGT